MGAVLRHSVSSGKMAESRKPALLVSACLIGDRCRFDGTDRFSARVAALGEMFRLIPLCPEVSGGLPTPRPPSERLGGRVIAKNGADFTVAFLRGAEKTLETARLNQVVGAVLKAKSPSCGVGRIYDGTFRGTLVDGDGVAAEWLRREGIPLWTEDDFINCEVENALRKIARDFENMIQEGE